MRILGIDPGSERTGYGLLESGGNDSRVILHGVITASSRRPIHERLRMIHEGLEAILDAHLPEVMAVEEIYFARDPRSAIVLGQVRGVILLAGAQRNLTIVPYSATRVKQAVSGSGRADKDQVQRMVSKLLNLDETPLRDAADALAIALCHAACFRMERLKDLSLRGSF